MASALKKHDTLDSMAATIARLRLELVDCEREAGELLGGEQAATDASQRVLAVRMVLEATKDRYIALSERERSKRCPVHGEALLVACPDCVRAWGFSATRVA